MLYKEISVWRPLGPTQAVRYVCFEQVGKALYCVQSADFYTLPMSQKTAQEHASKLLELLIEEPPAARCTWFETVEAAINEHDRLFGNSIPD